MNRDVKNKQKARVDESQKVDTMRRNDKDAGMGMLPHEMSGVTRFFFLCLHERRKRKFKENKNKRRGCCVCREGAHGLVVGLEARSRGTVREDWGRFPGTGKLLLRRGERFDGFCLISHEP